MTTASGCQWHRPFAHCAREDKKIAKCRTTGEHASHAAVSHADASLHAVPASRLSDGRYRHRHPAKTAFPRCLHSVFGQKPKQHLTTATPATFENTRTHSLLRNPPAPPVRCRDGQKRRDIFSREGFQCFTTTGGLLREVSSAPFRLTALRSVSRL